MKQFAFTGLLVLIAALGVALVWYSTRWGAFLSDDSYYYLKPARDALAGLGFNPSPIFGPMLPAFLTLLGWLGLEPLLGVRVLNAALFGVNLCLAGVIARQLQISAWFALVAVMLVALAENVIEVHGWAMSEALSITFGLLALYLALCYLNRPHWGWLVGSALAAGLACLTRFASLPVIAAIGFGLVFLNHSRSLKLRLVDAGIFGVLSLVPFGGYLLRTTSLLGRPLYYRQYTIVPFTWENISWYLYNTLNWFIPGRLLRDLEGIAALGLVVLFGIGSVVFWRLNRAKPVVDRQPVLSAAFWLLITFVGMYYLMLYVARGLSDLAIYNPRYLVPPLLILWLTLVYLLERLWQTKNRAVRVVVAVICLGYLGYYGFRAVDFIRQMHRTGLGYSNIGWHESDTIPYLKSHPDLPVVATGDMGIYFWTGQRPKVITDFGNLANLQAYVCKNNGALVIMKQMPPEIYRIDAAELIKGFTLEQEFNDSFIYRCSP